MATSAKKPPDGLIFSFSVERRNGHHHQESTSSPKARVAIAVFVVAVLADSSLGLFQKLAELLGGLVP